MVIFVIFGSLLLSLFGKEQHEHPALYLILCFLDERISYRFGMTFCMNFTFNNDRTPRAQTKSERKTLK